MLRVDLLCTVRVWVGEMRMEGNEIKKSFELLQRESASSENQVLSVTKVPQCKTNKRSGKLVFSS